MSVKQLFAKRLAKRAVKSTKKWAQNPIATQEKVLKGLLQKAKNRARYHVALPRSATPVLCLQTSTELKLISLYSSPFSTLDYT